VSRWLGAAGEALIKSFEELELTSYQDEGGIWTVGWGHTGSDVKPNMTITSEKAQALFKQDVSEAVYACDDDLPFSLTQNQFDAVVSFTFNCGVGAEEHSTLLALIKAGNLSAASQEFLKWDHVNGQVSDGLLRRREAEKALFDAPNQTPSSTSYTA
jgi:lysozyme